MSTEKKYESLKFLKSEIVGLMLMAIASGCCWSSFYCRGSPFGLGHGYSQWAEALFFKMAHKEERGSLNGNEWKGMHSCTAAGIGSGFLTMTYPHICLAGAAWRKLMKPGYGRYGRD